MCKRLLMFLVFIIFSQSICSWAQYVATIGAANVSSGGFSSINTQNLFASNQLPPKPNDSTHDKNKISLPSAKQVYMHSKKNLAILRGFVRYCNEHLDGSIQCPKN